MARSRPIKALLIGTITTGLTLASSQAFARTFYFPGAMCRPVPASQSCVDFNQYGVSNTCSSTAAIVECPLPVLHSNMLSTSVTLIKLWAYDRSTSDDVSCVVQKTDEAGNLQYDSILKTFAGGPGSGVQNSFIANPERGIGGLWRFRCTIPAAQSGWVSHVTGMQIVNADPDH